MAVSCLELKLEQPVVPEFDIWWLACLRHHGLDVCIGGLVLGFANGLALFLIDAAGNSEVQRSGVTSIAKLICSFTKPLHIFHGNFKLVLKQLITSVSNNCFGLKT